VRFVLSFDPRSLKLARDRWERLLLFATPYRFFPVKFSARCGEVFEA
jgi:hypothetical protein